MKIENSESVNELFGALAEAQKSFATATKEAENPFFRSSYATLENILEVILPVIGKYGLSFVQLSCPDDDGKLWLSTQINHKSGQWLRGYYPVVCKDPSDPQKLGSSTTYARRYALKAAFGIAEEDDDGNKGSQGNKANAKPPAQNKSNNNSKPTVGQSKTRPPTNAQIGRLFAIAEKSNWTKEEVDEFLQMKGYKGVKSLDTKEKYDRFISHLENNPKEK